MILVLSDLWLPFPGGAERLMFNVARALMPAHDVRVVTSYEAAQRFDGPPVDVVSLGVFDRHAEGAAALADVLATWRPRVIVTHHLFAAEFADELCDYGAPVVQLIYNGHRLPCASLAVYISDYVRRSCGDAEPDDMVMTPLAMPDVVASTHGDAIGFIKPLPHKGADLVYDVAELLPQRRFVVLRGEWQTLETTRALPNIEYLDPVDDIREFWRRVRLVLVPSVSEDAGTVPQEAALNRVPCISSDAGGLPETNRGGVVLASRSVRDWVDAVRRLDDPAAYDKVVAAQSLGLASAGHAYAMTTLRRRVAALAKK